MNVCLKKPTVPDAAVSCRVLVVDDDKEIRSLLCAYLSKHGIHASAVPDGKAMRRALRDSAYDLIILDLMLPVEPGLELCRELRTSSEVPIIILSARGDVNDRVAGFDVGADDYVPKPFSPQELLKRIQAVTRRSQVQRPATADAEALLFGGWRLDLQSRELTDPEGSVSSLGGATFRLLSVLLRRAPSVVSRQELFRLMHGREFDPFDRSMDVRISRLRQTLGEDTRSPKIIKTVYGEGYVIVVAVTKADS